MSQTTRPPETPPRTACIGAPREPGRMPKLSEEPALKGMLPDDPTDGGSLAASPENLRRVLSMLIPESYGIIITELPYFSDRLLQCVIISPSFASTPLLCR